MEIYVVHVAVIVDVVNAINIIFLFWLILHNFNYMKKYYAHIIVIDLSKYIKWKIIFLIVINKILEV